MFDIIWILIPLAPFLVGGLAIWTRHQHKIAELNAKTTAEMTAEKAAQYSSHVTELEQRVRVLERIVTDGGYNVAAQIEALRDQRRIEEPSAGVPLDTRQGERV